MMEWPYPVNYGKENEVEGDVLIVGSGIAGCHAAISAAKKGAKVVAVDKSSIKTSGSGGAGVDHWHLACTNPCSAVSPDELIEIVKEFPLGVTPEYGLGHTCYVTATEAYDALLDMERFGATIRDIDGEFAGAEFRDDKTKLMFAYDYDGKYILRVPGAWFKLALYNEMKRLGIKLYENIMVTSLLNQEGKQGSRIVGATGFNVLTGEFYQFKTKATVLPTGRIDNLWNYSSESKGQNSSVGDPNTGDGFYLAWKAGAEMTMMEASLPVSSMFEEWPPRYGYGNSRNTWYPCTLVDADGKEIPWIDRDGNELKTVSQRCHTVPGQKFFLYSFGYPFLPYKYRGPCLTLDLYDRILKGDFKLPLYADLPSMPKHERRAIFGLMVGNEGKTLYPIYLNYTKAGFDPDKDMLQVDVIPSEATPLKHKSPPMLGPSLRWFGFVGGFGGVVFDWDFKTTVDGLYAAGELLAGGADHSGSACSGRYAGRKAAECALKVAKPIINRSQLDREKSWIYAPLQNQGCNTDWKELRFGLNRVMQQYCPRYKNEELLKLGLWWLNSIRENEAAVTFARNPQELKHILETLERIAIGEIIIHASLARKASSKALDFHRLDYPEMDPPEWQKYVTIKQQNEEVKVGELPLNYWLLPPNAPTYRENYEKHCDL